MTLTDSVTRLFEEGKTANVPTIAGNTSDEGFNGYTNATQENPTPQNTTKLDPSTNRLTNLTDSQVFEIASFYPVNGSYGSVSPDNFFLDVFKAYWMAFGLFGDAGIFGSERMVGRWMSEAHGSTNIWTYRFNAPRKYPCPDGTSFIHQKLTECNISRWYKLQWNLSTRPGHTQLG